MTENLMKLNVKKTKAKMQAKYIDENYSILAGKNIKEEKLWHPLWKLKNGVNVCIRKV